MYIESIQLKDFRNYDSLELKFDRGTNYIKLVHTIEGLLGESGKQG